MTSSKASILVAMYAGRGSISQLATWPAKMLVTLTFIHIATTIVKSTMRQIDRTQRDRWTMGILLCKTILLSSAWAPPAQPWPSARLASARPLKLGLNEVVTPKSIKLTCNSATLVTPWSCLMSVAFTLVEANATFSFAWRAQSAQTLTHFNWPRRDHRQLSAPSTAQNATIKSSPAHWPSLLKVAIIAVPSAPTNCARRACPFTLPRANE